MSRTFLTWPASTNRNRYIASRTMLNTHRRPATSIRYFVLRPQGCVFDNQVRSPEPACRSRLTRGYVTSADAGRGVPSPRNPTRDERD